MAFAPGDFKFYQGSSGSTAWTRDLLWKAAISEEAKRMGFKPDQSKSTISTNTIGSRKNESQLPPPPISPRRLKPMDTSVALPSARSSSMSHHLQKLKQKLDTQETRQRAILARAEEMFVDRKKYGGTLNRKEATSWSSFMKNLKAPSKNISPLTGELDPQTMTISQTRFDSIPRPKSSSAHSKRTRLAQTRSFVADKNRRAANRAAIINERKQLLLGGRQPPFWTSSATQSQLGGRPATVAQNLYGTPVEDLVPRYGSVTDLPMYDRPNWDDEGDLSCGEVMAPLPDQNADPKAMYHSAYRLSYKVKEQNEGMNGDGVGVNELGEEFDEGGEEGGEGEWEGAVAAAAADGATRMEAVEEEEQQHQRQPTPQLGPSTSAQSYVLIPELNVSKTIAVSRGNDDHVDQSSDIIRKLEMEQEKIRTTSRMTGRRINKSRGGGGEGIIPMSSRRSQSRQSIRMRSHR